jgi:hypothetical protein
MSPDYPKVDVNNLDWNYKDAFILGHSVGIAGVVQVQKQKTPKTWFQIYQSWDTLNVRFAVRLTHFFTSKVDF